MDEKQKREGSWLFPVLLAAGGLGFLGIAYLVVRRPPQLEPGSDPPALPPAPNQNSAIATSPASSLPNEATPANPSDALTPRDIRRMAAAAEVPSTASSASASTAAPAPPKAASAGPARTLRLGASGEDVRGLQLLLGSLGYKVDTNGQFDRQTKQAVEAFQTAAKLKPVDGVVGPNTRDALQAAFRTAVIAAGARPLAP